MAKKKKFNPKIIRCLICKQEGTHSEQHDAYYCSNCNCWLEDKCFDDCCEYCNGRPEFPLPLTQNKIKNKRPFKKFEGSLSKKRNRQKNIIEDHNQLMAELDIN